MSRKSNLPCGTEFAMLAAMEDVTSTRVGKVFWTVAGVLLMLVWIASMPLDDDRLCATAPLGYAYGAVLLLALVGMVLGARPARPRLTCLIGLVAGLCLLVRCLAGDMLSETVRELPLILTAFVFYGAGYLLGQQRGGAALSLALVLGVLANVVYYFLMLDPEVPLEWMGRPTMSLAGPNFKGEGRTLLTYCNFATIFLMVAGVVLICRPLWAGWKSWGSFFAGIVGMVGVVVSCLCTGRSVLPLAVLMSVSAWMLWAIIRLYGAKNLGYGVVLSGMALLVAMLVMVAELFLGSALLGQILTVDTHGRTMIWSYIYGMLPDVPWCGYGAGATQWQLVPFINVGAMPNYAHNDYLQAWMDYGAAGLLLVLVVLGTHLISGFWAMASEEVGRERRALVAACMLIVLAMAGCALFEFVWHNVSLVAVTACACGVLAAPVPTRRESLRLRRKWAAGHKPPLRPVRPMGRSMTALCCIFCLTLALGCAGFSRVLMPACKAQWEYNALCHAGAAEAERALFLERVMEFYPDPELAEHYVTLAQPEGREDNLARTEQMIRAGLRSNPHHLYLTVMLSDVLCYAGRPAEAEELLREAYSRRATRGLAGTALANWPAYYGTALMAWGQQRLAVGDRAAALSMMEYALNLRSHQKNAFRHCGKAGQRNRAEKACAEARQVEVNLLRILGVQKDDSWMQPRRPGGPEALYAEWGREPQEPQTKMFGGAS